MNFVNSANFGQNKIENNQNDSNFIIFRKRNENMLTKCEKVNDFYTIYGISENPNPTQVPGFFEIKTQNPLF